MFDYKCTCIIGIAYYKHLYSASTISLNTPNNDNNVIFYYDNGYKRMYKWRINKDEKQILILLYFPYASFSFKLDKLHMNTKQFRRLQV